jgi:hypothetical protein
MVMPDGYFKKSLKKEFIMEFFFSQLLLFTIILLLDVLPWFRNDYVR